MRRFAVIGLCLGLFVGGYVWSQFGTRSSEAHGWDLGFGHLIAGTWLGENIIADGIPAPNYRNLGTICADGTYVTTNSKSVSRTGFWSPGHGRWERTGPREISMVQLDQAFDSEGKYLGIGKSRLVAVFSKDHDSAEFYYENEWFAKEGDLDPLVDDGEVTGTGTFTARKAPR